MWRLPLKDLLAVDRVFASVTLNYRDNTVCISLHLFVVSIFLRSVQEMARAEIARKDEKAENGRMILDTVPERTWT